MTTLVLSKPWRRWWRWNRRRLYVSPTPVKVLAMIGLLVAVDLYTKSRLVTEEWAWHNQAASWLLTPLLIVLISSPFLFFRHTRLAAIFTLAGTLGNTLSELRFDTIANPVQIQDGTTTIAFNLADVYLFAGLALAGSAVLSIVWTLIARR